MPNMTCGPGQKLLAIFTIVVENDGFTPVQLGNDLEISPESLAGVQKTCGCSEVCAQSVRGTT